MNCAVHTDQPAQAYCRTCGKPLCETCKRDVRGVIYCEDCIAARVSGTVPAAVAVAPGAVIPGAGPNAGLATILAAIFPFGVAQVYNGQYAKGLAHLIIFAVLVAGADHGSGGAFFGILLAGFYVYQIIDAHRSARALSLGQPAPDPLGLTGAFGTDNMRLHTLPFWPMMLVVIGFLFLLQNLGWFHFHWIGKLWPLILIALGLRVIFRHQSAGRC